jgi:hypothetical protein
VCAKIPARFCHQHVWEETFLPRKIDAENILAVLLADGWHEVAEGSFYLDDYEFHKQHWASQPLSDAPPAASWKDSDGYRFSCPLAAVLAVRLKPRVARGAP